MAQNQSQKPKYFSPAYPPQAYSWVILEEPSVAPNVFIREIVSSIIADSLYANLWQGHLPQAASREVDMY